MYIPYYIINKTLLKMSDFDLDQPTDHQKLELINKMIDKIETLKNPECLSILLEIDEEVRDKLYANLHKMERNDILSTFYKCYDGVDTPRYNFVCMNENFRRNQIRKLEDKLRRLQLG